MKTGIVRNVDPLGRIVIPIEFRRALEVGVGSPVEMSLEDGQVVVKKHDSTCYCCQKKSDTYEEILDRKLCPECYEYYKKAINVFK